MFRNGQIKRMFYARPKFLKPLVFTLKKTFLEQPNFAGRSWKNLPNKSKNFHRIRNAYSSKFRKGFYYGLFLNPNQAGLFGQSTGRRGVESAHRTF